MQSRSVVTDGFWGTTVLSSELGFDVLTQYVVGSSEKKGFAKKKKKKKGEKQFYSRSRLSKGRDEYTKAVLHWRELCRLDRDDASIMSRAWL